MKISLPKIDFNTLILEVSIIIFLVTSLLSTTFYFQYFKGYFTWIILFSVMLLFLKEMNSKNTLKSLIGLLIIFVLVVIGVLVSKQILLPASLVYIYSCRDVSFSRISKLFLYTSFVVLVCVIVSSKLGIVPDYIAYSSGRIRHFLGFRYALYPSTIITNVTMIYVYQKKSKIHYVSLFVLFLINYWIFVQTNSRLTFYTVVMVLLLSILLKMFPNILENSKKLFFLLVPSFLVSFWLSYSLSVHYDSTIDWQYKLNAILGNRLLLAKRSLMLYGISWFGQNVSWIGNGLDEFGNQATGTYSYVDSLYILILQRYGILFTVVFLLSTTLLLYFLLRRKEYFLMILVTINAVHGIIDDLILYLHYNVFWLLLGILVYGKYVIDNEKTLYGRE